MGQAKAKKMNAQKDIEQFNALIGKRLPCIAKAMRNVLEAATDSYAADCAMYAKVGEAVLKKLGFEKAQAVAGEAIWRVGPGDGDVITHAKSSAQQGASFYFKDDPSVDKRRHIFHAWIAIGGMHLLDLTTFSLGHKAKLLDAADGQHTQVDWCPDYLLTSLSDCKAVAEVAQSYDIGVYAYVRDLQIENMVFGADVNEDAIEENTDSVLQVLALIEGGSEVKVMVVDTDKGEILSAQDNIEKDLTIGLKQIELD